MKITIILLVLALFISCTKNPKQITVPDVVKSKVSSLYPKVKDINWKSENSDFEAEFEIDGRAISLVIDERGNIIETESEINADQLPSAISEYISKNYPRHSIVKTEKINRKEKIYYEVKLLKDGKKTEFFFNTDGEILKSEAAEKNNEGHQEIEESEETNWRDDFDVNKSDLVSQGANDYFILQPGYQLVLKGEEDGSPVRLEILVLNETREIDGVMTRVVEERETKNGVLIEVSRNFFAINQSTKDVYYFGEDVDIYKKGKVVGHEGAWKAGQNGARFGLMMPAVLQVGDKFYQEMAPGVAMDRAEIVSLKESFKTPIKEFSGCLKTEETTPLEPDAREYKIYAKGIGLIKDENLQLVKYGYVK